MKTQIPSFLKFKIWLKNNNSILMFLIFGKDLKLLKCFRFFNLFCFDIFHQKSCNTFKNKKKKKNHKSFMSNSTPGSRNKWPKKERSSKSIKLRNAASNYLNDRNLHQTIIVGRVFENILNGSEWFCNIFLFYAINSILILIIF